MTRSHDLVSASPVSTTSSLPPKSDYSGKNTKTEHSAPVKERSYINSEGNHERVAADDHGGVRAPYGAWENAEANARLDRLEAQYKSEAKAAKKEEKEIKKELKRRDSEMAKELKRRDSESAKEQPRPQVKDTITRRDSNGNIVQEDAKAESRAIGTHYDWDNNRNKIYTK